MENPKFVFRQIQNKIFKADEKLAIVVGTQALVLNSHPKLQFHLSSLEAAKDLVRSDPSEPSFP